MLILKQILTINKQSCLFFFLFILIRVYPTAAQQVTFDKVSLPEGSFAGIINGISQDPLGYMWFSVWNRGLYRSDGYHLVAYQADPLNPHSLATNAIDPVYADHKGIIWVGSENSGLDRLDPNTGIFTHFRHKANDVSSLSDDRVKTILEDHEGTLWVGTINGLNRLDQKTGAFTHYQHNPNDSTTLSCNQVRVLYEDRHNTLWVGTASFHNDSNRSAREGGLNRFDRTTGKFTRYLHNSEDSQTLTDNRIGAIFEDDRENFWVCSAGESLHLMDRKTGKFERLRYDPAHPEKLSGPPRKKEVDLDIDLFFIQQDGSGAVWIGASSGWITRYDPSTKKVAHYDSFNDDTQAMWAVSGGYTSRDGTLWITTWSGDVYRVDPFHNTIPHFPTASIVHAIHEDVSGELWIGTLGKGLIRTDRSKGTTKQFATGSQSPFSLSDSWITAIYAGDDDELWIGSHNHLHRYERKTQIFNQYINDSQDETSLSKGWIAAIVADQPGSLWIATEHGLDHLDIKTEVFTHYRNNPKDSNSLSDNFITSLLKDRSGNLWVGTRSGALNLFDSATKKFKHFACGFEIGSIVEDSENIVWIGTSNGLYRSNPAVDTFFLFTDPGFNLTATTMITGILEDNQKNLWVASSAGIFKFNPKRNDITVYNERQGVDPSGLSSVLMRGIKGRRGELFFGDRTGYYAFFPDRLKSNSKPPQIIIGNFWVDNKPMKPGKGSPLSLPITETKEIHLKHYQNYFAFDFTGIHYSSPEDNQHLFMLENLDNGWRKASPEKRAYYYNVPPGKYIFRVRISNSYGVWAEKNITILITPPWWSNWSFRIVAFFCVAALFYALIRWRIHQKFRLQLERSEKEKQLANLRHKTGELEMQALRAQMNPHFIFNCLSSINHFILKNESEMASDYLTKFSRLIRMVLNNSKNPLINLEEELEMLRLYIDLERLRFNNTFDYSINFYNHFDISSIFIPPLLLQPFAENAIWHGLMNKKEQGLMEVAFELDNGILNCYIIDNGIGRKNAETLKSKSAEKQKSMGMQITAERLALFNSDAEQTIFSIEDVVDGSGQAAGTRVTLKIRYRETSGVS